MTRFTDGYKTVSIKMYTWEHGAPTLDWENDFYDVGHLPYDEETDTYRVENVDYLIEQAHAWKSDGEDRVVVID